MARIKVKKVPKDIKPLYKQDPKTFALLDDRFQGEAEKRPEQDYNTHFPIVDREDANVEAEAGETILTPKLEHFRIGGKPHAKGGTPIFAEEGSFIFSNFPGLKIKGPVLEEFGVNPESKRAKKGVVPAELAKQYQTNKFIKMLKDPESTQMERETAGLMLQNYARKLDKLKIVQEGMKGFPDGVPEAAGLPQFQMGGAKKKARRVDTIPTSGYSFLGIEEGKHYWEKPGTPGQSGKGAPKTGKFAPQDPDKYLRQLAAKGYDFDELVKKKIVGAQWRDKYNSFLPATPGTPEDTVYWEAPAPKLTTTPMLGQQEFVGKDFQMIPREDEPLKTYTDPPYDTGYGFMDMANMAAPFFHPLNKYNPVRVHVDPEEIRYRPMDLEAQRQSVKGQTATAQRANNAFAANASVASSRNAQLLGQSVDPINQSFAAEFNANQAGQLGVDQFNAQQRAHTKQLNAGFDDSYNSRQAEVNDNFDQEKRYRLQAFMRSWNNAETHRQYRNAANVINQDFAITANGNIVRKPSSYDAERQFQRMKAAGQSGAGAIPSMDQFKATYPDLSGAKPEQLHSMYWQWLQTQYRDKNGDGFPDDVRTRNPYLMNPYPTYPTTED